MRSTMFFLFLFFCNCLQSPAFASIDKLAIDDQIKYFTMSQPINGLIYGVWKEGKLITMGALGESMTGVPASPEMHFRIGGVTETLLTTLMMKMQEEKIVNINETIDRWLPDIPNGKEISLKMLANGTSGYPDYVYDEQFIEKNLMEPFKLWSAEELLSFVLQKPLKFPPGKNQLYSHTDYILLSMILSKAAQKPIQELYKHYIFTPLQMNETQFNAENATLPAPVLHAFSQDRKVYEDSTYWNPSWVYGSGGVNGTLSDLGTWANAWMNSTLISEASTQQLRAPDTVGKGKNTKNLYFAMGFVVLNHWLVQNPQFNGYSGVFAVLPEEKIVFIAFNTLKETKNEVENLSVNLWKTLSAYLAPKYAFR